MAFKDRNTPPDLSSLLISLQQSDIIKKNPAFYQTVSELIKRTASNVNILENQILAVEQILDELSTLIQGATFLTHTDQFPVPLANSRQLLAGDNVQFDDSVPGERTVDVPLEQTFLTVADETVTLPNSRRVLAGTNVSFDDTVANVRTINVTGGGSGTDHVVMSDGGTPTPLPVDDGFGNFIYVPYTP